MSEKTKKIPKLRFPEFTDEWEQCKLGEVVEWTKGNGLSKSKLNKDKIGNNVVHYADLYTFSAIVNENISWSVSDEGVLIPNNSLLFPMSDVTSNGLARTTTVMKSGVKAGSDILIGILKENLCSKFLSLEINHYSRKMLPLITGTTVRHISSVNLSTLEISISTLPEQTKIGNFFKSVDDLITIHQEKLENLKKLKKSLLQKMFPKNGNNLPEIRFPEFTDTWEQCKLGEVGEIIAGGDIEKERLCLTGKYPVIANSLFNKGIIGYYGDYKIEAPAVTITGRGDTGIAIAREENFTPVVRLLVLKPKKNYYIYFLENAINIIKKYDESTGVPQLTVPQIKKFKILVPNIQEQTKIGNFFKSVDNLITIHQQKLEKLKKLKKGLLQQMFV